MKEIPLSYTAENRFLVRAGIKTQTRRKIGRVADPYGLSRLNVRYWVKEPVQVLEIGSGAMQIKYLDDGVERIVAATPKEISSLKERDDWRSPTISMFMRRRFARTWTSKVRVWQEELGAMSEADAIAEGICQSDDGWGLSGGPVLASDPVGAYIKLWDAINGKKMPWRSDLVVWVIEFKLLNQYF